MREGYIKPDSASYELFMLVLCFYAIGALAINTAMRLDRNTQRIIDYADNVVCILFL